MPYIPQTKTINATSIEILNAIRGDASPMYQNRVPVITQQNLTQAGGEIIRDSALTNEFLDALMNRIALVIITSKMYENPLKEFKKGILEYGETIEEIFVNIAKAHPFNPDVASDELYKREIPDVQSVFHRMNYQNFYKVTISVEMLQQAFLSVDGVTDLVGKCIESMYTGAENDEFLCMKNLIYTYGMNGKFFPVKVPALTSDTAKDIVKSIKSYVNVLPFMSDKFNYMGVSTHTAKENQIVLMDTNADATIDVDVLATAFNMDKAEFLAKRVLVDDFGGLKNVVAILVDKEWFMVYDKLLQMKSVENGQGLYINYILHNWKIFSVSPFANAIMFVTTDNVIKSVTLAPATFNIVKASGGIVNFVPTVEVTSGYPSKAVTYSISSDSATSKATIDEYGYLNVPANDSATTITVTCTCKADITKTATATVTVK